MIRLLPTGFALVLLAGCQSVQEQEAIRPLRDNGPKLSYDELLLRARKQADVAMDRAFRNTWADVQDVATALEQTVRLLPTAPQVPDKKDEIVKLCGSIEKDGRVTAQGAREEPVQVGKVGNPGRNRSSGCVPEGDAPRVARRAPGEVLPSGLS